MSRSARRPARSFSALLGAQICALLAGFLASILIARAIGPAGRGEVALLTAATLLVASIASTGLEGALAREAGGGGRHRAGKLALAWVSSLGVVVSLGWAGLGFLGTDYWRIPAETAAALCGVGCAAFIALNLWRAPLLGWQEFSAVAIGRVLFAVVLGGGTALLAAIGELTSERAIGLTFAAAGAQALCYWAAGGRFVVPMFERPGMRRHAAYAVKAQFGRLFETISDRYDLLLVGAFLATTDVGLYAVALSIAELCWIPVDAAALMVLGSAAADRHPVSTAAFATRLGVGLAVVEAAVLVAVAPLLLAVVFGAEFENSYPALLALVPGVVALAGWRLCMNDAAGRNRPLLKSVSAAVGAVALLVLAPLLIPLLGLVGAGIASSVGYGVTAAVGLTAYCRAYRVPAADLLVLRPRDAARAWTAISRREAWGRVG